MSGFVSIGDQTRLVYLRQANNLLKSRLGVLTQEATTGLKADLPAVLQGNMALISQVETRLITLRAYQQNATLAENEFSGLQNAMGVMEKIAQDSAPDLQVAATLGDRTSVDLRATGAREDFDVVVRMMNTNVGGRYVLSGAAVQTEPVSDARSILADLKMLLTGLTTADDMIAAASAWFDAGPNAAGFQKDHFRGAAETTSVGLSEQTTLANDMRATDPPFRQTLKGLALAALANDPDLGLDMAGQALVLREGGRALAAGAHQMTLARASVGLKQELIEQTATRNAAERTSLTIARADLVSADPYETASAITQTEANLQNLYALTARLSRLSLTEYLR